MNTVVFKQNNKLFVSYQIVMNSKLNAQKYFNDEALYYGNAIKITIL